MEEYRTYTLEELSIGKGSYGLAASAVPYDASLHTYLRITDINDDGTLNKWGLMSVDEDEAGKYLLKPNDIVFARTGNSTGRSYFYDGSDGELVYAGFLIKFSLDSTKVNPRILKYYTHSKPYYDWVQSFGTGSTRGNINAKTYGNMPITLPPRDIQDKIVDVLKSLDDKIEVNRRINDNFYYAFFEVMLIWLLTSLENDNLEQQAQALFKSWFVDFKPFRDQPFVESELGMIPQGWRVVSLDEACTKITDGSHFSPKDNPCGTIPMLSVKDMHHNGFDYSSCKMIDEVEYLKMKKNDCIPLFNDILVAKDGSYLKEIFICKEEKKQAILSSIAIFRSNPKVIYPDLLLQLLRLPKIKKDVGDNYVSGSALPRIVLKDFKKFKFVVPPVDIQETTIDVYISINAQIEKNETESRRLAELRNTLLPRLMSGELKVNEIENAI